jgi:hypothetical protein
MWQQAVEIPFWGRDKALRDELQGAESKARLDALPDSATPQIARKALSRAGWVEIGRWPHPSACAGVQPALRRPGTPIIPIATQRDPQKGISTAC